MRISLICVGRLGRAPEAALARDYAERAAATGRARVEGLPHCDWVLIDAGDVIVHLFRPEVRAFYNIEKIWSVEPPRVAAN